MAIREQNMHIKYKIQVALPYTYMTIYLFRPPSNNLIDG